MYFLCINEPISSYEQQKTEVVEKSSNPEWNKKITFKEYVSSCSEDERRSRFDVIHWSFVTKSSENVVTGFRRTAKTFMGRQKIQSR